VAEARYGTLKAKWGPARQERLARLVARARILPVDIATIEAVANLRNQCRTIGHPLHQSNHNADLWIAATAIRWSIPLVAHDAVFTGCLRAEREPDEAHFPWRLVPAMACSTPNVTRAGRASPNRTVAPVRWLARWREAVALGPEEATTNELGCMESPLSEAALDLLLRGAAGRTDAAWSDRFRCLPMSTRMWV